MAELHATAAVLRRTIPLLVRLGDFVRNDLDRCDVIADVHEAIARLTAAAESQPAPRKGKAPIARLSDVDVAGLSMAQLFAHYKATAPVEDVRFFVDACTRGGHQAIANQAIVLLADAERGTSRPEVYRRLRALQDSWRQAIDPRAPADEGGFWRAVRKVEGRRKGAELRAHCTRLERQIREAIQPERRSWGMSTEEVEATAITSAREAYRLAVELCPWAGIPA